MFETIREDLHAARKWNTGSLAWELINPGTQAVIVHRFGHWVYHLRVPVLRHVLLIVHIFLDYYIRACIGVTISPRADIGPGLLIHSTGGIYVPPVRVGRDFVLQKGAHLNWNVRGIGDDVILGPGCHIGSDVRIGSRVIIGPNAVVTSDVPDDATVAVLPPRVLRIRLGKRKAPPTEALRAAESNGRGAKAASPATGGAGPGTGSPPPAAPEATPEPVP